MGPGKTPLPESTPLTSTPVKYLKVSVADLIADLGFPNASIHGWQIRLVPGPDPNSELLFFKFTQVLRNGDIGLSETSTMLNYSLCESADLVSIDFLNSETNYEGEAVEVDVTIGGFTEAFLSLPESAHFYYLTYDDLDFMLGNNPTNIYISSCNLNYGGAISMQDFTDIPMIKFECADAGGQLQISANNTAPKPLFLLAPPCPPRWNDTFGGGIGGGGLVVQIGSGLIVANPGPGIS